mmetsp:Transcript_18815/g.71666  ORF Transcript_18815/g.71666 Transcript_18815/m.71666 type:complete len:246 (+) Transcript_18815:2459-3196(+)
MSAMGSALAMAMTASEGPCSRRPAALPELITDASDPRRWRRLASSAASTPAPKRRADIVGDRLMRAAVGEGGATAPESGGEPRPTAALLARPRGSSTRWRKLDDDATPVTPPVDPDREMRPRGCPPGGLSPAAVGEYPPPARGVPPQDPDGESAAAESSSSLPSNAALPSPSVAAPSCSLSSARRASCCSQVVIMCGRNTLLAALAPRRVPFFISFASPARMLPMVSEFSTISSMPSSSPVLTHS